jgi:RNase P subunit RPR2
MTTLNIMKCVKHTPNKNAISIVEDTKYTFCENCEQNIYSHYIEDYDIMSYWSSWKVGK